MMNMTYKEKLQHPKWQKKRLCILERDSWRCRSCGSEDKNLQVHHLIYAKRDPWDYPDHVLRTLCWECHEQRQELTDKAVDALRMAVADIPTQRLSLVAERIINQAMQALE